MTIEDMPMEPTFRSEFTAWATADNVEGKTGESGISITEAEVDTDGYRDELGCVGYELANWSNWNEKLADELLTEMEYKRVDDWTLGSGHYYATVIPTY